MELHSFRQKTSRKGIAHYYNNTYMFNLYVYFGEYADVEDILGFESRLSDACAIPQNNNQDVAIVITKSGNTADVIAHEALHGTNMVLDYRGVFPCFKNDEAQAYLLSWFVKCIYDAKKQKRKKK